MAEKGKDIWHYLALLAALGFVFFLGDNVVVAFRPAATFVCRPGAINDAPFSRTSHIAGITISTIRKQSPIYLMDNSEMDLVPKNGRDGTDQHNGKEHTEGVRPSVGSRKPLAIPHPVSTRTVNETSGSNAGNNQYTRDGTAEENANQFASTKTKSCAKEKNGEEAKNAINSKSFVRYNGVRPSVIEANVVRTNGNLKAKNAPPQDANIVDGKSSPGLFNAKKSKATQSNSPRETSNKPASTHDIAEVASEIVSAVSPSNRSSVAVPAANESDEATKPGAGLTEKTLKTTLPAQSPAENSSAVISEEEKLRTGQPVPKHRIEVNERTGTSVRGRIHDALSGKNDNIISSHARVQLPVSSPPPSYHKTGGAQVTSASSTTARMEKDGASAVAASKSKAANKMVTGEHGNMLQPSSQELHSTDRPTVGAVKNQTMNNALSSQTNIYDYTKTGESTSGSDGNGSSNGSNPPEDDKLRRPSTTPSGKKYGINHRKNADTATRADLRSPLASHKSLASGTTSPMNCSSSDAYPEVKSASILTNASKNSSTLASPGIRSGCNNSASLSPQKPDTVAKGTNIPRSKSTLDGIYEMTEDVNRLVQGNDIRTKYGINPGNKTSDDDSSFISSTPIDAANLHTTKTDLDLRLVVTPESSSKPEKANQEERRMPPSVSTASNPTIRQNDTTPLVVEALPREKPTLRSSSDDVGSIFEGASSRGEWGSTTEVKIRAATTVSTNTSQVKGFANFQDDSDLFASLSDKQNKPSSVGKAANATDIATSETSGKETQVYDGNKSSQSSNDRLTKNRSERKVESRANGSETRQVQNVTVFGECRNSRQDGGVPNQKVFMAKGTGHDEPSSTRRKGRDSMTGAPERRHRHVGNYAIAVPSPNDPLTDAMNRAAQARKTIGNSFSTYVEQQLEGFHSSHGKKIDLAVYGGQQLATAALDGGRSALFGIKAILDAVTSDEVGRAANETFRKSMTFVRRVVDLANTGGNTNESSGDDANIALHQKVENDGSGALQNHHPDTTKRKLSKTIRSAQSAMAAFGTTSVAFVRKMQSDVATGRAVEAAREMVERSASALSAVALLGAKHVASMEEASRGDVNDRKRDGEPMTPHPESRGRSGNGEEKFRRNSLNLLAKLRGARNGTSKRAMNGGSTGRKMKGDAGNMYFATPVNKVDS